jgi:hypothetical protein
MRQYIKENMKLPGELISMVPTKNENSSNPGRRTKVARLLDEYDLKELGEELEKLWTTENERRSLRELADYFNRRLLKQQLENVNDHVLDGESSNMYRLLTGEDVSSAERTRVERQLERNGINVDTLTSDFVTYQAIRTYLVEDRGAEYKPDRKDPLEREKQNLEQLRGRTVAVTEDKLVQLRENGDVTLGEFSTLVDIRVVCEDCNTQRTVVELLNDGGCNCSSS